jgi:uncharacterized repeat protein (TIGR02543 family)
LFVVWPAPLAGGGGDSSSSSPVIEEPPPASGGDTGGNAAPFTFSVKVTGNGSVSDNQTPKLIDPCTASTGVCSGTYASGAAITLTATPAAGDTFTGWGGDCSGVASTVAVTMNASYNCTAIFTATGGTIVAPPAGSNSYWTMDGYTFLNYGSSQTSNNTLFNPALYVTVADGSATNGGTTLTITFIDIGPGIYNIVPSEPTAGASLMEVQSSITTLTGISAVYTATSGQIQVAQGSDGKYHFTSVGSLPTTKIFDAPNGIGPNSPQTMSLTRYNAY